MSSVGNNGNNNNNDPILTLAQRSLEEAAQKRGAKALEDIAKLKGKDIIALLGMTPEAIKGKAAGAPKANKYSASSAAKSLPPPSAPKCPITAETSRHFETLSKSIHDALETVKKGAQPINWQAFTPLIKATRTPAEAKSQATAATAAAQKALDTIGYQFAHISSNDMTMIFAQLRNKGGTNQLNINSQLGNMQTAVRKLSLDQQIKEDDKAQVALNKAIKKQKVLNVLGPLFTALVTVVLAIVVVASAGGLAMMLIGMLVGALVDGAATGKKKGDGFDLTGAIEGMSMGAMAMPAGMALMALIKGAETAIEKAVTTAVTTATKDAGKKAAEKAAGTGADVAAQAAGSAARASTKTATESVEADAEKVAEKEALKVARAAADKQSAASEFEGQIKMPEISKAVSAEIKKIFGKNFMDRFTQIQTKMNGLRDAHEGSLVSTKTERMLTMGMANLQAATDTIKNVETLSITNLNLDAQEDLNSGKMYGEFAKIAQDSWKGTQDLLSAMQDQHDTGTKQIMSILKEKAQLALKVIQNISS